MKQLINYINESLFWSNKYISKNDLIKLAKEAIKNANVKPQDIQNEISKYEDPDDLFAAYDNNELDNYASFENAMYNLLEDNPKYKGITDNIMDNVFDKIYDIMEEV